MGKNVIINHATAGTSQNILDITALPMTINISVEGNRGKKMGLSHFCALHLMAPTKLPVFIRIAA